MITVLLVGRDGDTHLLEVDAFRKDLLLPLREQEFGPWQPGGKVTGFCYKQFRWVPPVDLDDLLFFLYEEA